MLDIDDTEDRVHGRRSSPCSTAHYGGYCFLPIHVYEATAGKPVAVILRPGKTPDGAEVALVLRHVIRAHPRPLAEGRHPWSAGTATTASSTNRLAPAAERCSKRTATRV